MALGFREMKGRMINVEGLWPRACNKETDAVAMMIWLECFIQLLIVN